jgi:uncharacterized membrane-anchored protein YhcB (DUF1043 family)
MAEKSRKKEEKEKEIRDKIKEELDKKQREELNEMKSNSNSILHTLGSLYKQ